MLELLLAIAVLVLAVGWVWLIEMPARRDRERRPWGSTTRRDDGSAARRRW